MKYQQIVPNILKNVRSMSVVLGRWQTGWSRGKGPSTLKDTEGRLDLKPRPVPFLRPLPRSHCNNWINLFYSRRLGSKQRRGGEIRKEGRKERNRPKIPLPSLQILEMLSPRAKLFLPQLKSDREQTQVEFTYSKTLRMSWSNQWSAQSSGKGLLYRLGSRIYLLNNLCHLPHLHWANHPTLTSTFSPHQSWRPKTGQCAKLETWTSPLPPTHTPHFVIPTSRPLSPQAPIRSNPVTIRAFSRAQNP